jgi:DNA-binding CsgD family transcriptional regulator
MTCNKSGLKKVRIRALVSMGTTLKATRNSPEHHEVVRHRIAKLTPAELEICLLHLVDGHSQAEIADWFGLTLRAVQKSVTLSVLKVPELRPLRTKSLQKPKRPRILQLSQLRPTERGPFNADEL